MEGFIVKNSVKERKYNFTFYLGLAFVTFFVFLFFMSYVYSKDPIAMDLANKFSLPNSENLLGTDQFGRDILARIMYSMRSVFSVGIGSVFVGAFFGTLIGAVAGGSHKIIERILMSFIDGLVAFPGILLAMLVVFIMGRGPLNTVVAIGIMMIPVYARLTFSTILEEKEKLHIKAAKSYGMGKFEIINNHIFPVLFPKLVTQFTSNIAGAIMIESSLSFLGLGIQPPYASLGLMLKEAQQTVLLHPFVIIPPGLSLIVVILGFVLLGDTLSDMLISRRSG